MLAISTDGQHLGLDYKLSVRYPGDNAFNCDVYDDLVPFSQQLFGECGSSGWTVLVDTYTGNDVARSSPVILPSPYRFMYQ